MTGYKFQFLRGESRLLRCISLQYYYYTVMGSLRLSRPISSGIGMLLLQFIMLSLQAMDTEAAWWRSSQQDEPQVSKSKIILAKDLPRDATFEADSLAVLGDTGRGKELYDQSTSMMAGHTCWQKAYSGMRTSCRDILNDETKKSRLALRLTDCFLMTSGRPGLKNCPNNIPIVSCVRVLDDHTHKIFLAFFVDIAQMCHYLQSEEFKAETEAAVMMLKDTAHRTQDKLETMGMHLDSQNLQLKENTGLIIEAQEILQKGNEALQLSIQEGMERIQQSSEHVRSGLETVHDMQKDVARQHDQLTVVLSTELTDLQRKSNTLATSLGSLYGTVEELAESSEAGRKLALQGLTDIQILQEEAKEQRREDLKKLSHEALKVYDSYRSWQAQLGGAHDQLVQTATQITKNHDTILSRQSQVNELIMEVLQALMTLQKGWMFESRLLRSATVYVGTSVLIYVVTTTKKTRSSRLGLYLGLFAMAIFEMYIVRFGVEDSINREGYVWPPTKLSWLRYTYFAGAFGFLSYNYMTYKDYLVLNHNMLARNVDLMNDLALDISAITKEMKAMNSRQGHVEEALGIERRDRDEKDKAQRRTRFARPINPGVSKPPEDQLPITTRRPRDAKDRRSQTSPW